MNKAILLAAMLMGTAAFAEKSDALADDALDAQVAGPSEEAAEPEVAVYLPSAGACEARHPVLNHTIRGEWKDGAAEVQLFGSTYEGELVGMRDHGDGFKLSIRYVDGIMGPSEAIMFGMPGENGETIYRMGWVSYIEMDDGEKLIDTMSGFVPANCVTLD